MLFNLNKFGLSTIILNCFIHATHTHTRVPKPSQMNSEFDAASALGSIPCSIFHAAMEKPEAYAAAITVFIWWKFDFATVPPHLIRLSFSYKFASVGKHWLVSGGVRQMFAFCAKHNSLFFFFVLLSLRRNLPSIRAERSEYYALDGDGVTDRRDELSPHSYPAECVCVRYYPIWDQSLHNLD